MITEYLLEHGAKVNTEREVSVTHKKMQIILLLLRGHAHLAEPRPSVH